MSKREHFASLIAEKVSEVAPDKDNFIASLMRDKPESQQAVFPELQLGRKNKINARGKIKKTFEMDPGIEKRLRDTANRYNATSTELLHFVLDAFLDKP